jgi:hypothetical protein
VKAGRLSEAIPCSNAPWPPGSGASVPITLTLGPPGKSRVCSAVREVYRTRATHPRRTRVANCRQCANGVARPFLTISMVPFSVRTSCTDSTGHRPRKSPQVRVPAAFPQESHGRNGTLRHTAARLLPWPGKPLTSLYAGEAG